MKKVDHPRYELWPRQHRLSRRHIHARRLGRYYQRPNHLLNKETFRVGNSLRIAAEFVHHAVAIGNISILFKVSSFPFGYWKLSRQLESLYPGKWIATIPHTQLRYKLYG